MKISPRYLMTLIEKVEKTLWDEWDSSKYKNVLNYIEKWHESDNWNYQNFCIYFRDEKNTEIDLNRTLHKMDGELLLKIAVDLGLETPNFIPSIPLIKNDLNGSYENAHASFEEATKNIEENPDTSIDRANSTLESIIKHILEDERITLKWNKKNSLYKLTQDLIKALQIDHGQDISQEIRNIGSSLLTISQNIEDLRSSKTKAHGRGPKDKIINEKMCAYFVVNSVATVGLFLKSLYQEKYLPVVPENNEKIVYESDIKPEDLPF